MVCITYVPCSMFIQCLMARDCTVKHLRCAVVRRCTQGELGGGEAQHPRPAGHKPRVPAFPDCGFELQQGQASEGVFTAREDVHRVQRMQQAARGLQEEALHRSVYLQLASMHAC